MIKLFVFQKQSFIDNLKQISGALEAASVAECLQQQEDPHQIAPSGCIPCLPSWMPFIKAELLCV